MKHIYIVRHGQSEANANVRGLLSPLGEYVNDCDFALTPLGSRQAADVGTKISKIASEENYKKYNIYISPFKRTRQTATQLQLSLAGKGMFANKQVEDPRLVEQDFGDFDFQHREHWPKMSPHSYKVNQARYHDPLGRFFARLENGENLLDVYNRVSLFVTTRLERDMLNSKVSNYIIVTHGNTMRVLRMFLLDMQIESFNDMQLPKNAGGFHIGFNELTGEYQYLGEF